MSTVIWIVIYLAFPALILFLCGKVSILGKVGAVLLCYLSGIIVGNSGILPEGFTNQLGFLSEASVALSLPLLLFSMNIKKWVKVAGKAMLSMLGAIIAVTATATVLFFIFRDSSTESHILSGMSVGIYTGGTPNLAAIKTALNANENTYILFHTYDTIVSIFYIMFIIAGAQKVFGKFLPSSVEVVSSAAEDGNAQTDACDDSPDSYHGIFKRKTLLGLGIAFIMSAAIVGTALLLSGYIPADYSTAFTIIMITSLSILLSCIPRVRNIEKTFQFGCT